MRALIRSRRVTLPLAALALAGTAVAAHGAVADDSPRYRTVEAATGDVEQELVLSGVIAPSGRSDLAFGTDGTVARVRVEQGAEVSRGDVLAVLDRASSRAAVDAAASDLADAKAQLADDREAQASAVSAATSASEPATTSRGSGTGSGAGRGSGDAPSAASAATTKVLAELEAGQDAVQTAQTAASTALAGASAALTSQQQACSDPAVVTTDAATADAPGEPAEGTTATAVLSEGCAAALVTVQAAQATAADAQGALQEALADLGSTLTKAWGSVDTDSDTDSDTDPDTGAAPATPAASTGSGDALTASGTSGGRSVTAATLAQDQAGIDRAAADLAAAKAALAGAVVRAPADGTVAALSVAAGDDVSAGSTVVTLVAPGLTTVALEVSVTQAARLEVGTTVQVTPAGATEVLGGTVGRIDHTASAASNASTGTSTTYPVEIVLDDRDLALADGMTASVAVVVGSAQDVVVVPASAISDATVAVLDDQGLPERVRVTTGVVGATLVEITDGVEAGDEVVLADLDAALPSADTDTQVPGGVGGPGGGGGGFTGGPPGGVRMFR